MAIVKLWIFADRRDVPLLMNEMVDLLQQRVIEAWILPTGIISEIYNNTTEESAIRRMLVDMYANIAGSDEAVYIKPDSDDYPKHFLCDWVKSLIATDPRKPRLNKEKYKKVEMCPSFHVHEEGVKCKRKGTKRSRDEMED